MMSLSPADSRDGASDDGADEVSHLVHNIFLYVNENLESTDTQLLLALLNAYVPRYYHQESECLQILGAPDPVHGGPPFEQKLEPGVMNLDDLGISRSGTVMRLMSSLRGDQTEPELIKFIKYLLTKREMGEQGLDKFSRLIEDILEHEGFHKALKVLRTASYKFRNSPVFPQAVARLNYIARKPPHHGYAKLWAKKAIRIDPLNSYFADTLGQIYKHRLLRTRGTEEIMNIADKAFKAFGDVEMKAEAEEGSETVTGALVRTSKTFNNRGLFGFLQVAKIVFEKLGEQQHQSLIRRLKMEVEARFEFFEWYLTYSRPDTQTSEPLYFWKDVALCYKLYTTKSAAESSSFPGLLACLSHGLFTSKETRAGFLQAKKTLSDLEEVRGVLKTTYEENVDDVKVAERYILSNIVLSNKTPDSPQLTRELKTIIQRFLKKDERTRSPGFYLLVLLLSWPEEKPPALQDEATALPLDLSDCVTLMEKAFERAKYAKYLRGRYLLPLFFLGRGSGLSKWVHRSRLEAVVEETVAAELAGGQHTGVKKAVRIADMWNKGEAWQVKGIQDILLPVPVEFNQSVTGPQEQDEQEVWVCVGEKKIKASKDPQVEAAVLSSPLVYLGLNIQGPVFFPVGSGEEDSPAGRHGNATHRSSDL